MKILIFLFFFGWSYPLEAQEDAWSTTTDNLQPGKEVRLDPIEQEDLLYTPFSPEENDPFEDFNRVMFGFNEFIDMVLLDPLSRMYCDVVPEYARMRIAYALRNLCEPVVFANNLLQGKLEAARVTLGRFVVNSTVGLAGLYDASTDLGLPYRREDLGLTFAFWGVESGPYLVLPLLGPSTARDAWGRLGDYLLDPINWWAFTQKKDAYSFARTGVQVLDAKVSNLELMKDLKANAIDYYATIRAWYYERRKDLRLERSERQALETPRPDDDED